MIRRRLVRGALAGLVAWVVLQPFGTASLAQRREVQPVERVAAITRPAVVYLEVFWEGWLRDRRDNKVWLEDAIQTGATCSGSLLTPDGYVLTAGHCVEAELIIGDLVQGTVDAYVANGDVAQEDARSFYDEVSENSTAEGPGRDGAPLVPTITVYRGIVEDGERAGDSFEAEVVDLLSFANSKGDTAILKLDKATDLPTIELSDETDIGVGTPIVAIGYPGSVSRIIDPTLEPTFKDGTVSAQRTQSGVPFYEVSAASSPGMSGGPVVDLEGRQIGVVSQAPADESQSFNLMVSASVARDLMEENDVRSRRGPNDATYRQGLEQLFGGEFTAAIASFDRVLEADPKHQSAFEIREQAAKRRTESGGDATGSTGGSSVFPVIPLLIGAGGVAYTVMRRRRREPDTPAAEPAAAAGAVGVAPATDPLTCSHCGHVHQRAVAFCTKCGSSMAPGEQAPAAGAKPGTGGRDRLILIGSVAAVAVAAIGFLVMNRGSDEGSFLATPSPSASAAPRAEGPAIDGQWASTFGPVTFEHDAISDDLDPVDVTGSWLQGPDKEGEITSGTFDPDGRTLEIAYVETWSEVEGTATFTLSRDGDTLDGTYEQPGARGAWTLTR